MICLFIYLFQFSFQTIVIISDRYFIYRWLQCYESGEPLSVFLSSGRICEYRVPSKLLDFHPTWG